MGTTNMKLGSPIKANYGIQKQGLSKVKNMFQLLDLSDLDISLLLTVIHAWIHTKDEFCIMVIQLQVVQPDR